MLDVPRGTLCARWLRFLVQQDPRLERDITELLKRFAVLEGLPVLELEAQFAREEAEARDREEANWWVRNARQARVKMKGVACRA